MKINLIQFKNNLKIYPNKNKNNLKFYHNKNNNAISILKML